MKQNMIRNMFLALVLIASTFIISCQKMIPTIISVYYNISNETDNKITVLYHYIPHDGGQEYDTIISIETGQKRILLVHVNSSGNPETKDTLKRISLIRVYNNDSIESQKNYRLTKYWKYKEYFAKSDFTLYIKPEDF